MSLEELVRRKNALLLELEQAKVSSASRRSRWDLASRAATLESQVARELRGMQRDEDAAINLVSQASCLRDADRLSEMRRVLECAASLTQQPRLKAWIEAELKTVHAVRVPAEMFRAAASIDGNENLRLPQKAAFSAVKHHFSRSSERALVQLPVGCGKTGTMAILPFGVSAGRTLLVAPNLEIAGNLARELDYSSPESFLRKTKVLKNGAGPSAALLDTDARLVDADQADYVVANVQQLVAAQGKKWLSGMSTDYFDLILVDESHHAAAESWGTVLAHFPDAKVAGFTATPLRADGREVEGQVVYKYPISEAIRSGYVSDVASRVIQPTEIHFEFRGETRKHTLEEVLKLREEAWFSRGVALSRECNSNIVDASIQAMRELRAGSDIKHQIIAAACSVDHAKAIRSLYAERGLEADVIHSDMHADDQREVRRRIRETQVDVVVQVQMLGEGADYKTLSVAAIFRPFRHIVPYIQFIGRVMRVVRQNSPGHPDNRAFVVAHVGLHVDRWWDDLKRLDEGDQLVLREIAESSRAFLNPNPGPGDPALRPFRPDMEVLREEIAHFIEDGFLPKDGEAMVDDLVAALALRGFNIADLGLSRQALLDSLMQAAPVTRAGSVSSEFVQPQRERQEAQRRLNERVKAAAKKLVAQLGYSVQGVELVRQAAVGASNNLAAAVILLNSEVNTFLGVSTRERDLLGAEESRRAHDAMDEIVARVAQRMLGSGEE